MIFNEIINGEIFLYQGSPFKKINAGTATNVGDEKVRRQFDWNTIVYRVEDQNAEKEKD